MSNRVTIRIAGSLCVTLFALRGFTFAQGEFTDQVILQGSTVSSRVTIQCEITDYTGESVVIRTAASKTERRFPVSQLVSIQTPKMASHERGLKHLENGDYQQAESELTQALTDEARRWMRREILADLIRCSLRQNQYSAAGIQFQRLYAADQTTRHIRLIPLVWDNVAVDHETRMTASTWMKEKAAIKRLIGASLLLRDPQWGESAQAVLRVLLQEPERRIRSLATWQAWRLKQKSRDISDLELARHETQIDELEKNLQPGPWYLIGQAHLNRQEYDLAAAAFLRIPLIYDSDHPVTAQAMFNAARALEQIGFRSQAALLDQEITERYAWSTAAKLSRQALRRPVAEPSTE